MEKEFSVNSGLLDSAREKVIYAPPSWVCKNRHLALGRISLGFKHLFADKKGIFSCKFKHCVLKSYLHKIEKIYALWQNYYN